ncbi:hypothetical protein THERMOT_224 [Bathymodiolus thermophilus thioautotrophic gill symbiont]|nr:hypothetical protein THERMOT_224 [Bathymodiolus thermophilus thioautotrophic gill symbiont]
MFTPLENRFCAYYLRPLLNMNNRQASAFHPLNNFLNP